MLPLETLMRAAEGGEREAELVLADFRQAGLDGWLRAAIERRLDPALVGRVVPAGAAAAASGALEAFYALWGRWFPSEYRRVRREWVVLQARWRADALVDPAAAVGPITSRFFSEGLVDVASVVVPAAAGGFEAGLEPLEAAAGDGGATGRESASAPEREPGGEPGVAEVSGDRESSGHGPAPLVGTGPVPARLPDGTEILADAGGLASSAACERLDQAVRGGVAAVEEVRAAWLGGSGVWFRWPASGRWQERSR
ncbi:MAG: hypothetical protein OXF93_03785 [Acidobacteria bacterium]|nr:hypothetical protein [Acidobacteriota bacterium]